MTYVSSLGGVAINYEVEGYGAPLVLQHGFTDSLMTRYEYGYVEALAPHYRLILIDARGHGASDKPHDSSAYAGAAMARDVVAVLDDLGVYRSAFFGHSMGGSIGLLLAHHAPTRLTALAIGGSAPDRGPSATGDPFVPLLKQGPEAMLSAWLALGPISPELRDRILAIDCAAMLSLRRADRQSADLDTEALARLPGRYRFFMGLGDWAYPDMLAALDRLQPGSLVTIPGVNHLESFQRSELLVPHLISFLTEAANHNATIG